MLAVAFRHSRQDAAADRHAARCARLIDGLLDSELAEALDIVLWAARAQIHVERHSDAERHLSRALPLARSTRFFHAFVAALATAQVLTGRLDQAWQHALGAFEEPDSYSFEQHPCWYDLLTQAALSMGQVDQAATWAKRTAQAPAVPGGAGYGLLAEARVLAARGERPQAVRLAREAARRFAAAGETLYEGQARLLAGTAHADAGLARIELSRAKELFESCGSPHFIEQALAGLRNTGARRTRGSAGSADLTSREREIALLVGEGLTNQQIAGRLRLSVKTVESHLSKVFRKAGVTSRSALVTSLAGQPRT